MRSTFLKAILRTAALAGASVLLTAGVSSAADVYLQAQSVPKTLPGLVAPVPMWVFVCDFGTSEDPIPNPNCADSASGPRIDAAAGDNLTIHLTNTLPTPVSIVIPGQAGGGDPEPFTDTRGRQRVRSLTHETGAGATTPVTYTWNSVSPGTYLYQSGTHPSIQVPMGLYGALVVHGPGHTPTAPVAYTGIGYDAGALLLFSEIDPLQNQRVADAAAASMSLTTACVSLADYVELGTTGYPCTVEYNASYFLINGEAYNKTTPPAALPVAAPGSVLLRLLNAGLRSHVPTVVGLDMGLVAEDGNPYPGLLKQQSEALLPAGKTLDALVAMPGPDATHALFDRMPASSPDALPAGGMLAYLQVGGGSTPPPPPSVYAENDSYNVPEDSSPFTSPTSVLDNDITLPAGATVTVVSGPSNGTLTLRSDGTFDYTPNPNYSGPDGFTYSASDGGNSWAAQVTLNVSFENDVPVAADDGPYVNAIGTTITVAAPGVLGNDSDPEGDTLTAVIDGTAPAGLTLNADGSFTYTGAAVTFSYTAADGGGSSAPATVTLNFNPVANIALNVQEPPVGTVPGAAVADYRWVVQEDATYNIDPVAPLAPSATLSTNFHKSYMPVVAQGSGATEFAQVALDPAKRYYVSVLPSDGAVESGDGHTMGGAQIPAGTSGAPITVIVNKQPIPTAQVSVLVFEDNNPTNGAPDPTEPPLGGFQIVLEDAAGRYGQAGGTMSQDAFGAPLRNWLDCFAGAPAPPMGVILTCPNTPANIASRVAGTALIKDLPPGKYGVIAVTPASQVGNWTQTSTIEGTKVIDAWVKAGEPPFFAEFGVASFHAFIGFVNPAHTTVDPGIPPGLRNNTIKGAVTMVHPARAPSPEAFDSGSYAALAHTRAWVGLNSGAGGGPNIQTVQADPDGNFTLSGIPAGTHQLVIWDAYLDQIIAFQTVIVAGPNQTLDVGNIPVNAWFGRHEHNVFLDSNEDGIRQDDEPGLPEQAVNLRFRDGTVFQSFPTDTEGFVPFDQIFPFGSWQVAEVDYTRFKATGVTVNVDGGGDVSGGPFPGLLNPQVGSPRTETEPSPVLLEGFQSNAGMTSVFEWGKKPYAPGENGGISGIVFYGSTRGENDPRLTVGDPWEPGIPGVKVRLYREVARSGGETALALAQEVETDSWDANTPTGCEGESASDPFVTTTLGGDRTRCFDGVRNWEQVRPAVFDGGYAFNDIPPGKYVVEVVPPPGYELIKEEDVNVGFGDAFLTAAVSPPAGGPGTFIFPDAATVAAALAPEPGLAQPPCVGELRDVPDFLSLFPSEEIPAPFAGASRPLCNRKQVILSDQGQAAADFHLFTTTPVAGQFQGLTTDDIAIETNPASASFGDKWGPAFMPISMRDFNGQEVYRTYSDTFGRYNGVLPSTFTANIPVPSGYSPAMHLVCLNDPTRADGTSDPYRNENYGTFCYTLQYMPGATTYLDTPLVPQAAFAAGFNSVDCACTDGTPKIKQVDGTGAGPLVAPGGTLTIHSQGTAVSVPNPNYEGPLGADKNLTITRDFGFGNGGSVTLGGTSLSCSWGSTQISCAVPNTFAPGTYQLGVSRNNGKSSINTVTVTVGAEGPNVHRVSPAPAPAQPIQDAIDAANPGDLILVAPGTYSELVVMHKPVRLQGSGAATIINGLRLPTEKLETWRTKVKGLVDSGAVDLLPNQPAGEFDLVAGGLFGTELGAGITVLAKNDTSWNATNAPRIDGFTITGADAGGGIFVNGYAHYLQIANNNVTGNMGNLHGGIRVGHPFLQPAGDGPFAYDNNVSIHHNAITLNGARSSGAVGGGLSLSTGTNNYAVTRNYFCGNFSLGDGGGIGHFGLSHNGLINLNQILFNQSFNPSVTRSGGGIMIAGEPPAAGATLTLGTGNVTVDSNLVQGNQAGSGHGGGIRTQRVNGRDVQLSPNQPNNWYAVTMTNNMVVNNVAGWSGAGIALQDTANASIILNTVANNDSTATVGALVAANSTTPQPAGISSERHSLALDAVIPGNQSSRRNFSNPTLTHNIVWHNRAFTYDGTGGTATARLLPELAATSVGQCPAGANYFDLGVLDPGFDLSPQFSILTVAIPGNNSSADPQFLSQYCNGARTLSAPGPMQVAVEVTEGGNFIDVRYGPLTQIWPATPGSAPWNYHIAGTSPAIDRPGTQPSGANVDHDFDNQGRPIGVRVDLGADEVASGGPPPTPPTLTSINPTSGVQGASSVAVNLTGTSLSGTSAVNVSGTGVTCSVNSSTSTTVNATCSITATAPIGARNVSVTTPVGTSGTVTFTVNAPGAMLYFSTVGNFAVPGVAGPYDDADIYAWNGTSFTRVFDGSVAGLPGSADIDALLVVDADTFYMSFNSTDTSVPTLGNVQDEDVVLYDAGVWSVFFDGTNVGLTQNSDDVDAFDILTDGSVVISTLGNGSVPGVGAFNDEDLLRCVGTFGTTTSCTWTMYFDGSDVALSAGSEDVDGVSVSAGSIFLTTTGTFSVAGLSGQGVDVFACNTPTTGPATACGSFSMFFDGSVYGITDNLDAIDRP